MGYTSLSGDGGGEVEVEDEEVSGRQHKSPDETFGRQHPMARFSQATAPRMRGVVAGPRDRERQREREGGRERACEQSLVVVEFSSLSLFLLSLSLMRGVDAGPTLSESLNRR